jgi:hypothetical protein
VSQICQVAQGKVTIVQDKCQWSSSIPCDTIEEISSPQNDLWVTAARKELIGALADNAVY